MSAEHTKGLRFGRALRVAGEEPTRARPVRGWRSSPTAMAHAHERHPTRVADPIVDPHVINR